MFRHTQSIPDQCVALLFWTFLNQASNSWNLALSLNSFLFTGFMISLIQVLISRPICLLSPEIYQSRSLLASVCAHDVSQIAFIKVKPRQSGRLLMFLFRTLPFIIYARDFFSEDRIIFNALMGCTSSASSQ